MGMGVSRGRKPPGAASLHARSYRKSTRALTFCNHCPCAQPAPPRPLFPYVKGEKGKIGGRGNFFIDPP